MHPLVILPLLELAVLLAHARGYGVFRDELYYAACSERLAWGYVDHPPLSLLILRGIRDVFGDNLLAMRGFAAVVASLNVLGVGWLTRRFGGGSLAQTLAMLAFMHMPVQWFYGHYYSMNGLDVLAWLAIAIAVVSLLDDPDAPRGRWLGFGALVGVATLNKLGVVWLVAGLVLGVLATKHRVRLLRSEPWIAVVVAALVVAPHVAWQVQHDSPTVEFISNATTRKMVAVSPAQFFRGQLDLLGGHLGAAFMLFGLVSLVADRSARRYAPLAWIFVTVALILISRGSSRASYLAPAYTWVAAAAGWRLEARLARLRRLRGPTGLAIVLALLGSTVWTLPHVLPVLSVESFIEMTRERGTTMKSAERKRLSALPQHYADMFGWREKLAAARRVAERLGPDERARACILTWNYGVAGALEFPQLVDGSSSTEKALPPVLSGHNNYGLWGPGTCTGDPLIIMGGDEQELETAFESLERVDVVRCRHCMPYENDQAVFVGRGPKMPLAEAWPQLVHFD